jgi:cell division protein FtsZ
MTINLQKPDLRELKPKITVFGVGGGGGNAINNMITGGLQGVEFVVANTDAQALTMTKASRIIQLGVDVTQGLGAGSQPEVGRDSAEECLNEIADHLQGTHMCFITAGMGGGTGTGAAPVVARAARELGILTVGVVTKPFHFEGARRMRTAEAGIAELQKHVDTLIVIPNQNLFGIANDKTTFADAFGMADQVLYSGVACITDLMVKEGLINLDFADVRSVMREMGKAMMGTGEASGAGRAMMAAETAISNPLLDETSMRGAKGLLISITGGRDMTLFEVDEAATRIREEVDPDANIILGATFDESLDGIIRVSVVATGIDRAAGAVGVPEAQPRAAARPAAAPRTVSRANPAPVAETRAVEQKTAERVVRDGVGIEPMRQPSLLSPDAMDEHFRTAFEEELLPQAGSFIPDAPEMPVAGQRMPEPQDFPPMVQAELRGEAVARAAEERSPIGLLGKIARGLGMREPEPEAAPQPTVRAQRAPVAPAAPRPAVRQEAPRAEDNPYAPKRASLDANGRIAPAQRAAESDDELDIPAFLRRQSS